MEYSVVSVGGTVHIIQRPEGADSWSVHSTVGGRADAGVMRAAIETAALLSDQAQDEPLQAAKLEEVEEVSVAQPATVESVEAPATDEAETALKADRQQEPSTTRRDEDALTTVEPATPATPASGKGNARSRS